MPPLAPRHTPLDVPSKGLETGQLEGTEGSAHRWPCPPEGFLVICSWHPALHVLPGQEGRGREQGAWGGTRQEGERKRTLKKGS